MTRINSNAWKVALLLIAVAMMMWACSTSPTNDEPINAKPVVEIVNIPPTNSHFTQSPTINWYGTDVDGYIIMYEYAVIPFDKIPASVDTSDVNALIAFAASSIKYVDGGDCEPACWTIVNVKESDSPTRQKVELVAGADPVDTVKQYFFVRAVDDDSARSDIRVRVYSRNNNPPNTVIKTTPDAQGYYDLPELSKTFTGIYLEWEGEDKIDFPSEVDDPTFDYFYQVFGPFDEGELSIDSLGDFTEGFEFDTLAAASRLVMQSKDTTTGSVWVDQTEHVFYNLWRKQPASTTTRDGYFVLKVTARDDAAVADKTPAYKAFYAIDPHFENDVLVYYPINGLASPQPGAVWDETWLLKDYWPDDWFVEDDMVEFFNDVFNEAGYDIPPIIRGKISSTDISSQNIPTKAQLAKYKVYVVLEDAEKTGLSKDHFVRMAQYMDLGGNVWLFGTTPFGPYQPGPDDGLTSFPLQSKVVADIVPFKYFNVTAQYRASWGETYKPRNLWLPTSGVPIPKANDDFVGATPLPGSGFPALTVDLYKVKRIYVHFFAPEQYGQRPWMNIDFRGAPNASYFVRDVYSEPLYLYKSYFGETIPDSMKAYLPRLQGTVCGLRYNSGTFKSAAFGFSLFCLQHDHAVAVVRKMMEWFLAD